MGRRRASPPEPQDHLVGDLRVAVVTYEIDLHGDTVPEALARLQDFLFTQSRTRSGSVVRVITGVGAHSGGRGRLRPAVEHALATGVTSRLVDEWRPEGNGGSFLIRLT